MPDHMPEPIPDSIRGFTRDNLYPPEIAVPPWLLEAEALHGRLLRAGCMAFPDGRLIHVTQFAKNWRLTLTNPANPAPEQTADVFVTPEAMEAIVFLWTLYRTSTEEPWPHLHALVS